MEFSRNSGLISPADQERLANAVVAIAGVGGDGGLIAELLARLGVGCGPKGEIRLADPDLFGPENINRQDFANSKTIGRNKSEVLAEQLRLISAAAIKRQPYVEGINAENIAEFIAGADVIIDETDYEKHWFGVIIARAAREANIPVFTGLNLAWGTQYTSFSPTGQTLENFLGLSNDDSIEEIISADG
jgi:tRNA A37 threonylcarbamoyladenosine dehydratase